MHWLLVITSVITWARGLFWYEDIYACAVDARGLPQLSFPQSLSTLFLRRWSGRLGNLPSKLRGPDFVVPATLELQVCVITPGPHIDGLNYHPSLHLQFLKNRTSNVRKSFSP